MKSKGIAYLLWIIGLFGTLGLHRFYLDKIGTGLIWLSSAGGLGVGSLYDLFTLSTQVDDFNINQKRNNILTNRQLIMKKISTVIFYIFEIIFFLIFIIGLIAEGFSTTVKFLGLINLLLTIVPLMWYQKKSVIKKNGTITIDKDFEKNQVEMIEKAIQEAKTESKLNKMEEEEDYEDEDDDDDSNGLFDVSIQSSYDSIDIKEKVKNSKFVGNDISLKLGNYEINNPMIYMSKTKYEDGDLPHVVNHKLPVNFKQYQKSLGYWPNYSEISPNARGNFILWLSGGRKDIDVDMGYVFIYFYGLEFRAIYEQQDINDILLEVLRLYELYNFNNSFKSYANGLITWLALKLNEYDNDLKEKLIKFVNNSSPYSQARSNGLEFKINKTEQITKDHIYSVIPTFENTTRSIIPQKSGEIFTKYFLLKIDFLWKEIKSSCEIRSGRYEYFPASSIYELRNKAIVENKSLFVPTKIKNKLSKLWSECIEDLRPYCKKIDKLDDKELYILLPDELKNVVKNPYQEIISHFEQTVLEKPGKIGSIVETLGGNFKQKLTLKESKALCEKIENMGFNIEPDARYFSKSYSWDDYCIIYKPLQLGIPESATYSTASLLFDLGISISNADGVIDDSEIEVIKDHIYNNVCKNDMEKERINHRVKLAMVGAITGKGVTKKLADRLKIKELESIGKYLFAISMADGILDHSELVALKKAFKDFGLNEDYFNSIIKQLGLVNAVNDLITLRKQKKEQTKGTKIPLKIESSIDHDKINQLIIDTNEIQDKLTPIFSQEKQEAEEKDQQIVEQESSEFKLNVDQQNFYNIMIKKANWDKNELKRIAIQNKLMLEDTITTINAWTDEQYGDYLISDENEIIVNLDLLKE